MLETRLVFKVILCYTIEPLSPVISLQFFLNYNLCFDDLTVQTDGYHYKILIICAKRHHIIFCYYLLSSVQHFGIQPRA